MSEYNKKPYKKSNFYNLDTLKAIPIIDVCEHLGLRIEKKSTRTWVKIRNERTASAVISPEKNTFYDFGSGDGGDSINLVALVMNVERKEAIKLLADMFGIEPENPRQGYDNGELTLWDYAAIGVYGDSVAKNLDTSEKENLSGRQLMEYMESYDIPVNEFRKTNPKEFAKIILQDRAQPYIKELKNEYFVSIWSHYSLLKNLDCLHLLENTCNNDEDLSKLYNKIIVAEKVYNRAIKGTKLKEMPERDYSPDKVVNDIIGNTLKLEYGPYNFKELKDLSERTGQDIKYRVVEYAKYFNDKIHDIAHTAYMADDKMIIGYLERDKDIIIEIYGEPDKPKTDKYKPVDSLVNGAKDRSGGPPTIDKINKKYNNR